MLRSEIYAGVWYYNKHRKCVPVRPLNRSRYRKSSQTSNRLRPRTEWLPLILGESLRIVERDQWERVQRQLNRNFAFSSRNSKHTYLLTGLVRCGACSARYVGDPSHGTFYYRCMARCKKCPTIKETLLDETVWQAVQEAMLTELPHFSSPFRRKQGYRLLKPFVLSARAGDF